jgi:CheY-like chemotaxis protein
MAPDRDNSDNITNIPQEMPPIRPTSDDTTRLDDFDTVEADVLPWVMEFRVVGTADIIHAPVKEEMLIGRSDDARGIYPDIDLSRHDARKAGVSREHARLCARDNRITIEDLQSANGVSVNGRQIAPRQPYRLREGDTVRLGHLQLQVHFVVKPLAVDDTVEGLDNSFDIARIGTGQTILILDDNRDVCHVLRYIALQAGFKTRVVHAMTDAITALADDTIDAMILEVMLPDGNGVDVIKYLRQRVSTTMPVIAIGNAGQRLSHAREQGATVIVPKPLVVDDLLTHLGKLVQLMDT